MATFVFEYTGTTTGSLTNGKNYTSVATDCTGFLVLDDNNKTSGAGWGDVGLEWTIISITTITVLYP